MDVKEDPEKGVFIKNLSQPEVTSVDQIESFMNYGNKNRSVGATAMNATSSRSHSLFTVRVETSETVEGTDEPRIKAGKLNLGTNNEGRNSACARARARARGVGPHARRARRAYDEYASAC